VVTTEHEVSELDLRHYVGGKPHGASSQQTVAIVNPATEETIAHVPRATPRDAELAIAAAREAFDHGPWPRLSGKQRGDILRQLADALWARRDYLVDLFVKQCGCVLSWARPLYVEGPIRALYKYAEYAETNPIEHFAVSGGAFGTGDGRVRHTLTIREPVGVVGIITPFNSPFHLNINKLGPALAAGNTVVLKPTEYTCLDAALIGQIAREETDLPDGVLNILLGGCADVGAIMAGHPLVDQISFTGSTRTGRRIMAIAADTIKRVTLELGGKSANVIFADADLDEALAGDCALVIRHAGQGCSHLSRVIAEDSIFDEVVERMVARAETIVVGDPTDPKTEMGPVISGAQWTRVMDYIQSGLAEGARLCVGGNRPLALPVGYFIEPTVFASGRPDMRIVQEEIFGPVVVVQRFSTEEEAIALANDSIYGLNGAVWSGDLDRGLRVAGRVRTGSISVNGPGAADYVAPSGGYKQSGIGREFGEAGYREYTEIKALRYRA
jgi:aldehyde dehydrogenase (NAD+)